MEEKNEIMETQEQPKNFEIVKDPKTGKYRKAMYYKQISSKVPETDEEVLQLFMVMNDTDNKLVTPMKNVVGLEFVLDEFHTSPYESLDEDTGEITRGVTTTIKDTDGNWYATSSKSVYYTILNTYDVFGSKIAGALKFQVTTKKVNNNNQINLAIIGKATKD